MKYSMGKIIAISVSALVGLFLLFSFLFTETMDYYSAVSDNTVMSYVEFRDKYPQSKYLSNVEEKKSFLEDGYFLRKKERNTILSYNEFLHAYPIGKHTVEAARLRDSLLQIELEIEKYGSNVLPQGCCPYDSVWGKNEKPKSKYNADIAVTAPIAFDMVAIVRQNNDSGRVVAHAYIQADSTYKFNVDNGRYQVFFYIGKGWNPNKNMSNGLKGGFVRNETYSKDNPVYLANEVIAYQLSMKRKKGYKESSRVEIFR